MTLNKIREMSDEPNSDAVDILSELENDAKNTNNEPEEQVTSVPEESTNSESEKIICPKDKKWVTVVTAMVLVI